MEFVSGWQHAQNYISTHRADWTWMDRRTKISRISSWKIWQPYTRVWLRTIGVIVRALCGPLTMRRTLQSRKTMMRAAACSPSDTSVSPSRNTTSSTNDAITINASNIYTTYTHTRRTLINLHSLTHSHIHAYIFYFNNPESAHKINTCKNNKRTLVLWLNEGHNAS